MTENSKTEPDWERVVEIFEAALEFAPAEREEFIQNSCGADGRLRGEVEAMLAADSEASGFIETPAVAAAPLSLFQKKLKVASTQTGALANRKIGAFRLEREIGRGGMGTVYSARREDGEFEQRVAVKLIRRGMDTDPVVRRFRQERQILANLDHPFIARLLDGGTTDEGTPYLVMEFVEGDALLDFCERERLPLGGRLELYKKICEAVAYAHARNILHRDLKPDNILVKRDSTPKLLDFGISKIYDADDLKPETGEQNSMTRWMMTPEYAAPEQIKGEKPTPASDIYSLGVILYKLAAGHAPYQFPSRSPFEIARVICEAAPQPIETGAVGAQLKRIIFKALAKNPADRFGSVKDLLENIESYLDQPSLPIVFSRLQPNEKKQNFQTEDARFNNTPEKIISRKAKRAQNDLSPRQKGIRQSAILLMTAAVGAPAIFFLSLALKLSPSWMLIFFVLTVSGGVMRLIYALLLETSEPENGSRQNDEAALQTAARQIYSTESRHLTAGSWMENSSVDDAPPNDNFPQNKK